MTNSPYNIRYYYSVSYYRAVVKVLSMVHYLSGFVARDLSGFAVERLFRFISSIQGGDRGDIDGSGKVSAKSQDEPVQKSLRQMEAEEADTERGGRAAWDNGEDIAPLHSPLQGRRHRRAFGPSPWEGVTQAGSSTGGPQRWWRCTGIFTRNAT